MLKLLLLLLITTVCSQKYTPKLSEHLELASEVQALEGEDLVEYINGIETTWTATSSNRFSDLTPAQSKNFLGLIDLPEDQKDILGENLFKNDIRFHADVLPEEFDSREQWSNCTSIKTVRDQSNCGSCWAVAATSAISDRICIHSNGQKQDFISAADLLGCCPVCGFGCHGGAPEVAWAYYWIRGLVSGGQYHDQHSCRPYPFAPCTHHSNSTKYPPCSGDLFPTPKCQKSCSNDQFVYNNDIHKAKYAYPVIWGESAIQREIFKNGPVEAGFAVFADFLSYKSGVYQHKAGLPLGGHAVKIIGWGVEHGIKYWLVANSWNESWGEKGLFKILRGHDHLGIEARVTAGIPRL